MPQQESFTPQSIQESMLEDAMEEEGVPPALPQLAGLRLQDMDLASFLIHRACNNSALANYFCW